LGGRLWRCGVPGFGRRRNLRAHGSELTIPLPPGVDSGADQHHHHHRNQRRQNAPLPAGAEPRLLHPGQRKRGPPELRQARQLGRLHGVFELGGHFLRVQTQHGRVLAHEALGENAAWQLAVFVGLDRLQHAR